MTVEVKPTAFINAIAHESDDQVAKNHAKFLIDVGVFPRMLARDLVEDIQRLQQLGMLESLLKPERPEKQSEQDSTIAGPRARAASGRMAMLVPAKSGRLWWTFHLVYEQAMTWGRWTATFTLSGITGKAMGVDPNELEGWRRNDTSEDLTELDRLGVFWYWPATGRGKGKWALVGLPPIPETAPTDGVQFEEGGQGTAKNCTHSPENCTHSTRSLRE